MTRLVLALVLVGASTAARADDGFELRGDAEVTAAPDDAATVSLTLAGTGGRTISKDAPVRIEVTSPTLKLSRARYQRSHAADPAADAPRFDLRFVAEAAGDHQLAVEARFWLCGKRVCRPVRAAKTIAVHAVP